jgi:hypothetical protein
METAFKSSQVCISEVHKQTNQRIYDRNIPSQMLQPYLDVRPVMTKYSHFPIVDPRKQNTVPMNQMPEYNVNQVFNPGNSKSPWSGFASNINLESELRNQVFALQKCSQSVYVPNSTSDLYNYTFKTVKQPNPHELLFVRDNFAGFNPNPDANTIGCNMFNNNTRCQVKNMTKQS